MPCVLSAFAGRFKGGQRESKTGKAAFRSIVVVRASGEAGGRAAVRWIPGKWDGCSRSARMTPLPWESGAFSLLYGVGPRRTEAVALQLEDYGRNNGELAVRGKGNRRRSVFASNGAKRAIDAWVHVGAPRPPLCPIDKAGRIAPGHGLGDDDPAEAPGSGARVLQPARSPPHVRQRPARSERRYRDHAAPLRSREPARHCPLRSPGKRSHAMGDDSAVCVDWPVCPLHSGRTAEAPVLLQDLRTSFLVGGDVKRSGTTLHPRALNAWRGPYPYRWCRWAPSGELQPSSAGKGLMNVASRHPLALALCALRALPAPTSPARCSTRQAPSRAAGRTCPWPHRATPPSRPS